MHSVWSGGKGTSANRALASASMKPALVMLLFEALSRAASSVHAVVKATQAAGSRELALIAAQDELTRPSERFAAQPV